MREKEIKTLEKNNKVRFNLNLFTINNKYKFRYT